jgi:protein SCO1/2
VVLLFFGYPSCPDVCPLTLAELQQVKQELGEQADELAVVFVTVDLETHTVERLAEYIPAFEPTFYGARMDETTLAAAQETYGIYAEKVDHEEHTAHGDSTVGHSDYTLAIDPQGNWRAVYAADVETEGIAADVQVSFDRVGMLDLI